MNKAKSAFLLTVLSVIIAVLCVACVVSFPLGGVSEYHSVISTIGKDADFGGGYFYVYYPDGVISAEEYETNSAAYGSDDAARQEYQDGYAAHANGAIYLEKETVLDEATGGISEEFKTSFENSFAALRSRYETKALAGTKLEIADEYTVRITLPLGADGVSNTIPVFGCFGEFSIAYGSEKTKIVEAKRNAAISDYVKGAYSRTTQDGTAYVIIDFTDLGRETLKKATAEAGSSSSTMYFMIGGQSLIRLTVSSQIDQESLAISGSYTDDSAQTVAIALDQAIKADPEQPLLNFCDINSTITIGTVDAPFGENAFLFSLISLGVLFAVLTVFMFVRYRGLGLAYLYGMLTFLCCISLCLCFIPFLTFNVGAVVVIALSMVLYTAFNSFMFERTKREYASGKTVAAASQSGYVKSVWQIVDICAVFALAALLTFAVALTELQAVAFTAMLSALLAGGSALLISRAAWYLALKLAKNPLKFCHFDSREEAEDNDD